MWTSHWTAKAAVLVGALLGGAAAETPLTVGQAAQAAPADVQELLLDVTINGQSFGTTMVLRQGGQLWVTVADFARWRLRLPADARLSYLGEEFASLTGIASGPVQLDEGALTLTMTVVPSSFEGTELRPDSGGATPTRSGYSAYLNYDFGVTYAENWSLDGAVDAGVSTPFGVGRSNAFLVRGPDGLSLVRGLTTWSVDLPQGPASVRIGDNFSQGGAWGASLLYGGVQWATNFALRPDESTAPQLSVQGETPVPGTASVYVNGSLVLTREVPAGPFTISGIPASVVTGVVRVTVRDAAGNVREIRQAFLSDASLLQPGLVAFAVDAGVLRQNYGVTSWDYGVPFASVLYRRGLTERLTGELHGEGSSGVAALGGNLIWAQPGAGVVRATLAGSRSAAGSGALVGLSVSGQQGRLSYGGNVTYRTPTFRQVGVEDAVQLVMGAGVGVGLGKGGDVSASLNFQRRSDGSQVSSLTGTYSVPVFGNPLSVGVTRQFAPEGRTAVSLSTSIKLGRDVTVGVGSDLHGAQGSVGRNTPAQGGLGYSANAGFAAGQFSGSGQLSSQGRNGTALLAGRLGPDGLNLHGRVQGSVSLLGGQVQLGQRIQDAYALVKVGAFGGVRVYRGGQLVGRTDAHGALIVPALTPYARNVLSIDTRDLPLNVTATQAEQTVVPYAGSGTVVNFTVRIQRSALLTLMLPTGEAVPLGATVRVDSDAMEYPVVGGGETYVEGLAERSRLRVTWEEGQCEAEIVYPQTQDPFAELGVITCVYS
ncbi:fimbria/pilus outer membrane usher protein (plasmid) [Deinococcus taeanensis]|uniref:fimbria/pilus outer membrane usher protein n=1 Tax=Deinococcus taeanensis TaxID=2737050 RepID=UPI001CDBA296|nr:fimbria/pilus outer membrane usher protein [Deinococcus taeanensis]UBV44472.1 fimbria/pilus outer membrane usher protein [Deinococcus taeanensis]